MPTQLRPGVLNKIRDGPVKRIRCRGIAEHQVSVWCVQQTKLGTPHAEPLNPGAPGQRQLSVEQTSEVLDVKRTAPLPRTGEKIPGSRCCKAFVPKFLAL